MDFIGSKLVFLIPVPEDIVVAESPGIELVEAFILRFFFQHITVVTSSIN